MNVIHGIAGLGAPSFCGGSGATTYATSDVTCDECRQIIFSNDTYAVRHKLIYAFEKILREHQWGQTILKPLSCSAGDWDVPPELFEATDDEQWDAYVDHVLTKIKARIEFRI